MICRSSRSPRGGFSMIEMLVVLAIIIILAGLLTSAIQQARESANRVQCANNLKQIGLATNLYYDHHKVLPPSRVALAEGPSWAWLLLPNMEQQALFDQWATGRPYPGIPAGIDPATITPAMIDETVRVITTKVPVYYCPSRPDRLAVPFAQDFV